MPSTSGGVCGCIETADLHLECLRMGHSLSLASWYSSKMSLRMRGSMTLQAHVDEVTG